MQIVGLVQCHCFLMAGVADSSGCVWDPMAPFPPVAKVYLVLEGNKVSALLLAIQVEALVEALPLACLAFFRDLEVHTVVEVPLARVPVPNP